MTKQKSEKPTSTAPQNQSDLWADMNNQQGTPGGGRTPVETSATEPHGNIITLASKPKDNGVKSVVERINLDYWHVVTSGKNVIVRMNKPAYGRGLEPELFKVPEFIQSFSHDTPVEVGSKSNGDSIYQSPAVVWLNNSGARFADRGLDFNPRKEPLSVESGKLNLWQGVSCEPVKPSIEQQENIDRYINHLLKVICSGDQTQYKYLMQHMAHAVQKPWEKPSVAVVMRSDEGTGKGTAINPLLSIFGSHSYSTTSSKDIVGDFNHALNNKIVVYFDEAFATGRKAAGAMNGLISEGYQRIERKGIDAGVVPNLMRIYIASNEEIPVPVSVSARRYFYLDVSEHRIGDAQYFNDLAFCQPANPQHEAFCQSLLYHLQNVDISDFTPYSAPATKGLLEQKLLGLNSVYQWIYHVLNTGELVLGAPFPENYHNEDCYRIAQEWVKLNSLKLPEGAPDRVIGRAMSKFGMESKVINVAGKSERRRVFETLDECRRKFEKYLRLSDGVLWARNDE